MAKEIKPTTDRKDKAATYTSGGVIGFLVALLLLGIGFEQGWLFPEAGPLVQVRLVDKHVTHTRKVIVTRDAVEKVYRVSVLDKDGKVIQTFDNISKFEFRIIGATLTPLNGSPFDVDGNISVEQVK